MEATRILFASCHGYIDSSSGAALSTRELMELFARGGMGARVLSTGVLDFAQETPLEKVLDGMDVPYNRARATLSAAISPTALQGVAREVDVFDLELGGVRVTLMSTASSRIARSPSPSESAAFLDLAEQVFDRFRPQILLTYGGHPICRHLIARARRRGIAVVFHLHNFEYSGRALFEDVNEIVVPTEYTGRHYAEVIGRECTVIPNALRRDRVVAEDPAPQYLTYVNPQQNKGLLVFARIAVELGRRRPEIPLLIVEGRGTSDSLANVPLDLSSLRNLHRMANTPDPREFYRMSRALLMPSLWRESFGRVAAEAMANGLPVLASDRGALPETIGSGGFILPVPARCTPTSGEVPTADEVEPWIEIIQRLWDDPDWEQDQRARAVEASRIWDEDRVLGQYAELFRSLLTEQGRNNSSI